MFNSSLGWHLSQTKIFIHICHWTSWKVKRELFELSQFLKSSKKDKTVNFVSRRQCRADLHNPEWQGVPDLVDAARRKAGAVPDLDRALPPRARQEVQPRERPGNRELYPLHPGGSENGWGQVISKLKFYFLRFFWLFKNDT